MKLCNSDNHYTTAPQTSQGAQKPTTNLPNHPQSSHKHPIIGRKSGFYVTKNFSDNAKHVLSWQPFYAITSAFTSEDQNQVGVV